MEFILLCVLCLHEYHPQPNLLGAPLSTIKENGYKSLCVVALWGLWAGLVGRRDQEIKTDFS